MSSYTGTTPGYTGMSQAHSDVKAVLVAQVSHFARILSIDADDSFIGFTMRLPLIGQKKIHFIGNLRLFWIYFYRLMANA